MGSRTSYIKEKTSFFIEFNIMDSTKIDLFPHMNSGEVIFSAFFLSFFKIF